jgi:hypothetical protein
MSLFKILQRPPLFTLSRSIPEPSPVKKLFSGWPTEQSQLILDAQSARDDLTKLCKQTDSSLGSRIDAVNRYLPLAVSIEAIKGSNPAIQVRGSERLKWLQSPIVVKKYVERSFSGAYWNVEVLHLIWLRAVSLLDNASVLFDEENGEAAASTLREVAGIFHYLATDRARGANPQELPIEFQPAVFNSFMSIALGQAYSIIAHKGETNNISPAGLAKLCFTIFATFSSSLDSIQSVQPPGLIAPQYVNWLKAVKAFYHAAAALYLSFALNAGGEFGKAIALIRLAIAELEAIPAIDALNKRVNEEAVAVLARAKAVEPEWSTSNFRIAGQVVPLKEEAERVLTAACTVMPNLPQPIPYVLPAPPDPASP